MSRTNAGRSSRLSATRFVLVLLTMTLISGGVSVATAQDATPTAWATVPAAPPWRAELVPRNRPLAMTVGTTPIRVEVANNDQERSLGLGQRAGLLPGTGMLFVFDGPPEVRNFWMGGMRFCLDIIWLRDGVITGAAENTCPGPPGESRDLIPRHQSPGAAEYVLEMPAGFLAGNDYGVGTPVGFSEDPYGLPTPEPTNG